MRFVEALATTTILVAATATTAARDDYSGGMAAHGPAGVTRQPLGGTADVLFSTGAPAGNSPDTHFVPPRENQLLAESGGSGVAEQPRAPVDRANGPQAVLRSTPAAPRLALERAAPGPAGVPARPPSWFDLQAKNSISTMLGGLAIVLGVFLLFAWAVRKRMPKGSARLPDEIIEVLGRTTLAAKQSLHLVRVGGNLIVVSVTANGPKTLTEITDPGEVARILAACQQQSIHSSTAAFQQVFEQFSREPASGFLDSQSPRSPYTRESKRAV